MIAKNPKLILKYAICMLLLSSVWLVSVNTQIFLITKHNYELKFLFKDGDTALHLCADNGSTQLVQYILNCGQPVELSPNNVSSYDTMKL